jgi:hypothetical protein
MKPLFFLSFSKIKSYNEQLVVLKKSDENGGALRKVSINRAKDSL